MDKLILSGAAVVTPEGVAEGIDIAIEGERIVAVAKGLGLKPDGEVIDLSGATIYPGFIDIHIHGAGGVDVMAASVGRLQEMAQFLARHGVTAWMPTFVPDAEDIYRAAVGAIDAFVAEQDNFSGARVLGLHYEGPFVSEHQCGALKPQFFRKFESGEELSSLPRMASANVRHMMTFAPEVTGGIDLTKALVAGGWIASIGHTRAGLEILDLAAAAGATHLTHFFNAMSGLHHRDVGVVGWGLAHDDITCDVIADGVHVAPPVLKILHRAKPAEKIALISDSVLPAGMGDGNYEIWGEQISVRDGKTRNGRGSIAGSIITMLDAVRMMLSLGIAGHEVAQMASLTPAKVVGVDKDRGSIEVGKRADLVALDKTGEAKLTVIGGRVV